MQAIGVGAARATGKVMRVNAAGAIGAIATELGPPWRIIRRIGVTSRAIGLVGHILEERENPLAYETWLRTEEEILKSAPRDAAEGFAASAARNAPGLGRPDGAAKRQAAPGHRGLGSDCPQRARCGKAAGPRRSTGHRGGDRFRRCHPDF